LVRFSGDYYIGGDHSRMVIPAPDFRFKQKSFHFTHVVLLNVRIWKLVYVSKPILYDYRGLGEWNPHCIQDPISLNPLAPGTSQYTVSNVNTQSEKVRPQWNSPTITQYPTASAVEGVHFVSTPITAIDQIYLFTVNIADWYSVIYEFNVSITASQVSAMEQEIHSVGQ
jgi:hypothetical protein